MDDEAQVRVDHLLLRPFVAALDALRQLDLLGRREQGIPAQLVHEEREGVRKLPVVGVIGQVELLLVLLLVDLDYVQCYVVQVTFLPVWVRRSSVVTAEAPGAPSGCSNAQIRKRGRGRAYSPRCTLPCFRRPGDREASASRKVRTPKGRTLGKSQAAKADGKWHRKETASGERLSGDAGGKGETVG